MTFKSTKQSEVLFLNSKFDWSTAGLSMDLPVFVYSHTKTSFRFLSRQRKYKEAFYVVTDLLLQTVESRVLDLKPNILMKDDEGVNIIDIACPYDLYIEATYKTKIEKYQCIKEFLNHQGIDCAVSAIIIGSLGTVHSQALKVLMNLKMNKRVAKGLHKWCSTGNIMWAKRLWNLRCKLDKEGRIEDKNTIKGMN